MSKSFVPRAVAVAAITGLVIVIGCVSTPSRSAKDPRFLSQSKTITLKSGEEMDVKFEQPYADVPVVELKDDFMNNLKLLDRQPDHFRVRNDNYTTVQVTWTATGDRVPSPPQLVPVPSTPAK